MPLIYPPSPGLHSKQLRERRLRWQSRIVLIVLPVAVLYLGWNLRFALRPWSSATITALFISVGFAYLVWRLHAATAGAAVTGGILTACVYFGSIRGSSSGWVHSGIVPLLILFVLTYLSTRFRRHHKERQGTAEPRQGRNAAQVCANLGVAALIQVPLVFIPLFTFTQRTYSFSAGSLWLAPLLAALIEATADTVSSELGQVLGGTPRLLTTLGPVAAGTDGAVSFAGTATGIASAAAIASVGLVALKIDATTAWIAFGAGNVGFLFDSLLGATLERAGYLNNDAVNFLSTLAAAAVAGFVAYLS